MSSKAAPERRAPKEQPSKETKGESGGAAAKDWGADPQSGGVRTQVKLALMLIITLGTAFGYLVHRKFDALRQGLLAAEEPGGEVFVPLASAGSSSGEVNLAAPGQSSEPLGPTSLAGSETPRQAPEPPPVLSWTPENVATNGAAGPATFPAQNVTSTESTAAGGTASLPPAEQSEPGGDATSEIKDLFPAATATANAAPPTAEIPQATSSADPFPGNAGLAGGGPVAAPEMQTEPRAFPGAGASSPTADPFLATTGVVEEPRDAALIAAANRSTVPPQFEPQETAAAPPPGASPATSEPLFVPGGGEPALANSGSDVNSGAGAWSPAASPPAAATSAEPNGGTPSNDPFLSSTPTAPNAAPTAAPIAASSDPFFPPDQRSGSTPPASLAGAAASPVASATSRTPTGAFPVTAAPVEMEFAGPASQTPSQSPALPTLPATDFAAPTTPEVGPSAEPNEPLIVQSEPFGARTPLQTEPAPLQEPAFNAPPSAPAFTPPTAPAATPAGRLQEPISTAAAPGSEWSPSLIETPGSARPGAGSPSFDSFPSQAESNIARGETLYTVRPGDSYWSISRGQYGSGRYHAALLEFNRERATNSERIVPGSQVAIPPVDLLETRFAALLHVETSSPASASAPAVESGRFYVSSDGRPLYRVGAGDTLTGIAQRHLGRASRWEQIAELNLDVLPSPERLKPGMVLQLPPDASQVAVTPTR